MSDFQSLLRYVINKEILYFSYSKDYIPYCLYKKLIFWCPVVNFFFEFFFTWIIDNSDINKNTFQWVHWALKIFKNHKLLTFFFLNKYYKLGFSLLIYLNWVYLELISCFILFFTRIIDNSDNNKNRFQRVHRAPNIFKNHIFF